MNFRIHNFKARNRGVFSDHLSADVFTSASSVAALSEEVTRVLYKSSIAESK